MMPLAASNPAGLIAPAIEKVRAFELRADRPSGRGARLGRAPQPVLLDRPSERVWRVLGDADPAVRLHRPARPRLPARRRRGALPVPDTAPRTLAEHHRRGRHNDRDGTIWLDDKLVSSCATSNVPIRHGASPCCATSIRSARTRAERSARTRAASVRYSRKLPSKRSARSRRRAFARQPASNTASTPSKAGW